MLKRVTILVPYLQIDAAMGKLFGTLAKIKYAVAKNTPMQAEFYDDPDLGAEEHLQVSACTPSA